MREALRLLEQQDVLQSEKLRWLQQAWQDGIASGDSGELDLIQLKAEAREKLAVARKA